MDKVKLHVLKYKRAYALIIAIFIVVSIVFMVGKYIEDDDAVLIERTTINNVSELAKTLDVTENTAKNIKVEIQQQEEPIISYYVQSPNVKSAARETQKQINNQNKALPSVVTEKSDRTIVTANEPQQKVDVYKINLSPKIIRGVDYSVNISDVSHAVVGYDVSRRISENGNYLGVRTQYDTKDKEIFVGARYTW